jgi:hypothetical protein
MGTDVYLRLFDCATTLDAQTSDPVSKATRIPAGYSVDRPQKCDIKDIIVTE